MKTVAAWVAGLIVVIGAGVGTTSAIGGRSALPNTPAGVALAYLQMIQSGDCADGANLLYDLTPALRTQCRHDPTQANAEVLGTKLLAEHVTGARQVYEVTVTFSSGDYGWVAYSPVPPSKPVPNEVTWQLQVAQLSNGRFVVLPPALP